MAFLFLLSALLSLDLDRIQRNSLSKEIKVLNISSIRMHVHLHCSRDKLFLQNLTSSDHFQEFGGIIFIVRNYRNWYRIVHAIRANQFQILSNYIIMYLSSDQIIGNLIRTCLQKLNKRIHTKYLLFQACFQSFVSYTRWQSHSYTHFCTYLFLLFRISISE